MYLALYWPLVDREHVRKGFIHQSTRLSTLVETAARLFAGAALTLPPHPCYIFVKRFGGLAAALPARERVGAGIGGESLRRRGDDDTWQR